MTLLSPEQSKDLFRKALRVRLIEQKIAELYTEYEMRCPTHFSIGQEAIAVGVCAHLSKEDLVTSAHRSHAHYLSKGGNLKAMLAELYGKETGCASGKGGSMHLIDREAGFLGAVPIVGSTVPIGVGASFAAHLQGTSTLTAIFFGDAATETGVFYESLNFAALHKLPVIMVCENNFYSVMTSLRERRPEGFEIHKIAQPFGVFCAQGDGNDIDDVFTISQKAIEHARSGQGPALLEFKTYRHIEHCGPLSDDHLPYRPKTELEEWKKRDPIHLYKDRLLNKKYITEDEILEWTRIIHKEIDEAVLYAKSSAFPHRSTLEQGLFAA